MVLNRVLTKQQTDLLQQTYDLLFGNLQWCAGEWGNQCPICRVVVPNHSPSCELDKLQKDISKVLRAQGIMVDDTIHSVRIERGEDDGRNEAESP